MIAPIPHTEALFGYLSLAVDFFNKRHWDGTLPPVALNAQRNPRALGFYHQNIFARMESGVFVGKADELSMNPQHMATRTPKEVIATLVHELCHHWQAHFGKQNPSRAYHNKEWGVEMKRVGLYPSSTGQEGGKETGQYISHYIVPGGPFDVACDEFLKAHPPVFFQDRNALSRAGLGSLGRGEDDDEDGEGEGAEPKKPRSKGRAKFTCPKCKLNATAKPSALLVCGVDGITMESEDAAE